MVSLSEVPRVPNWPDWDFCSGSWEVSAPVVDGCEAMDRRPSLRQHPGWKDGLPPQLLPQLATGRQEADDPG